MDELTLDKNQETIETWAFVEIMGHSKIAGRVSERKVGVQVMLQVDVPKADEGLAFTKLYNPSSIFSITPTTEEWCRKFVKARVEYPVLPYIPESRQLQEPKMTNGFYNEPEEDFDEDDEDDGDEF
jgi:hypothetical protein